MSTRHRTTTLSLAALTMLLGALAVPLGSAAAQQPTTGQPQLIVYSNHHSPGVSVHTRAQARRLHGAPASFKRFIGRTAQGLTDDSSCQHAYVGVTVARLRTDGFAVGGVNDCGGYAALWAQVDGRWKEIAGTQDSWPCRPLHRYRVPSSIVGRTCYDYKHGEQHPYHQG